MMPEGRLIEMSTQITKKKPPMVKAIREFITAMEFPPLKNENSEANMKLAAVVLAALMHCNVPEDAKTVTGTPSLAQIAAILRCSPRTIQRRLVKMKEAGMLTTERRGTLSSSFTFYRDRQTGQQLSPQETGQQLSPDDTTTKPLDTTTQAVRHDNSDALTRQLLPLTGQQLSYSGITQDTSQEKISQDSLRADGLESGTEGSGDSKTGRLVNPTAPSKEPAKDNCVCCGMLGKVGTPVARRGPNGYCQKHNGEMFWLGEEE
jgi:hypothetical protein